MLGRSPGEGNGNPLQDSQLRNPTDRGPWWAAVHGVTKESDTNERLNTSKNVPNSVCEGEVDKAHLEENKWLRDT